MNKNRGNIPLIVQFIHYAGKGFSLLDEKARSEIREFILSKQHENGGLTNKVGRPDLYYSLFGVWLAKGLDLNDVLGKHRNFILHYEVDSNNLVSFFASILIKSVLFSPDFSKPSFWLLVRKVLKQDSSTPFFYRLFFFFLAIETFYPRRVFYFLIRVVLIIYRPSLDSPCSIHAAFTLAGRQAGMKTRREEEILFGFYEENRGFKPFSDHDRSGLLSTAVALLALKNSGRDLRVVAPGCLDFIQGKYKKGAFVAGEGDQVPDLEYTFYGLLALGTLA